MAGFPQAVEIILRAEGGLVDDPRDPGKRTNRGITTATWERWRGRLGKPGTAVDACTRVDATRIYFDIWHRGICDALPWPLSLAHFDSCVQHREAAKLLQRMLGVTDDGIIGPVTLEAVQRATDPRRLAEDLIWTRLEYYRSLPTFPHHGRGWLDRMAQLRRYVVGYRPLPKVA